MDQEIKEIESHNYYTCEEIIKENINPYLTLNQNDLLLMLRCLNSVEDVLTIDLSFKRRRGDWYGQILFPTFNWDSLYHLDYIKSDLNFGIINEGNFGVTYSINDILVLKIFKDKKLFGEIKEIINIYKHFPLLSCGYLMYYGKSSIDNAFRTYIQMRKMGFLHLDVKPSNVLNYMLIDADNLTLQHLKKKRLCQSDTNFYEKTRDLEVQEMKNLLTSMKLSIKPMIIMVNRTSGAEVLRTICQTYLIVINDYDYDDTIKWLISNEYIRNREKVNKITRVIYEINDYEKSDGNSNDYRSWVKKYKGVYNQDSFDPKVWQTIDGKKVDYEIKTSSDDPHADLHQGNGRYGVNNLYKIEKDYSCKSICCISDY